MRLGNLGEAIDILERVIRERPGTPALPSPTLALCYAQAGERPQAAALLQDDTLAAAEADSEMAYRLATYFAVEGDSTEALPLVPPRHLSRQRELPMVPETNPAWNNLRTNTDFERILEDLKKSWRKNQRTWKRLLEQVPPEAE